MEKYIKQLLKDLRDHDEHIRLAAARTLSEVAVGEKSVIKLLFEATRDKVWFVRLAAVQALEELDFRNSDCVEVFAERLLDEHEDVREWAAWALGKMGETAHSVSPALGLLALKDPVFYVQMTAVEALGKIGAPNDTDVIAVLEQVLKIDNPEIRDNASEAISVLKKKTKDA